MKALLLSAAALAAPLSAAAAQPPRPDPAGFEQAMARMRAARADDLAIVLALRPAQRPALDQWLTAVVPPPRPAGPEDRRAGDGTPPTTADRLARQQSRLAERTQRGTQRIEATRRFYAALDPQQQRVFDALERLRHGEHRGGDRHGDGPPPPPPSMHGA